MDHKAASGKKNSEAFRGLGLSSAWRFFLVSDGFQAHWAHVGPRIPNAKEKCWKYVWAFGTLVLSPNRKGFPLGVDFGASWAMFRPVLGHLGRQGDRRGPNLNSDVKNPCVCAPSIKSKTVHYRAVKPR